MSNKSTRIKKRESTERKLKHGNLESLFLIIRGIEVGVVAGAITVLYRFLLEKAEQYLYTIIELSKEKPVYTAMWFALLILMGVTVSLIVKKVPDAGGSGIPQVSGELKGLLSMDWWKVIIAKLFGGTLSVFSGLSLGREGPSIQFGAMAGKGMARVTKADKTTELRMTSVGGGAGFAAAFNAPLAGTMFVLEQFYHSFDRAVLCMGITACVTADLISKFFFGQSTVFNYESVNIPLRYYWLVILFGIILGISGCFYNTITMGFLKSYGKLKLPSWLKMAIIFGISGIVGYYIPEILCGGHSMFVLLNNEHPELNVLIFLLFAKFIFGVISAGSGAPGGTLYPLTILGMFLGSAYGAIALNIFPNLSPNMWQEFAVIGIAGLFASIVRAPITGIIIVFEISGNINNILPIALATLISYAIANMLNVQPIYDALLNHIMKGHKEVTNAPKIGEKVIRSFVIATGNPIAGKKISEVNWGKHCLIISVNRGEVSITPNGDTQLQVGDEVEFLISQRHFAKDTENLVEIFDDSLIES